MGLGIAMKLKDVRRPIPVEDRVGVEFERYFTAHLGEGKTPYDDVTWELRTASIGNDKGAVIFEQRDVEAPADWSQTATNIVVSKYFYGKIGTPERETSVRQLIGRVVDTIAGWGKGQRYFKTPADAENFRNELAHIMLTQKACFNSPVWFNVGVKEPRGYGWHYDESTDRVKPLDRGELRPQCSACFINSVGDTLESILDLAKTEGMLFKWGSGTGTNLSTLREEDGLLSSGGKASGPLSFMKGFDAFAGVIKSGGKTRRAAKMVILNADHPDIEKFIWCKAKEEKKAHTLIDAGYDSSLDGDAYGSIFFQNANNSVRVTDEFMEAAASDADWWTKSRLAMQPVKRLKARDLLREISEATWQCGDPGMQFDTTVNRWHTSKNTARINASNPCSEYMFLDDSACNLASLNLMKFVKTDGSFDVEAYRHAVDTVILAQEIIVDNAAYPTEKIAKNSHDFRPLGLGYANLGALLMWMGIPYDSDHGRDWAAALTAIMCGQAYLTSARISEGSTGPCEGYAVNEEPFLDVIRMHRDSTSRIDSRRVPQHVYENARQCWEEAYELGKAAGFRNAQTTVIAPTGTIGFMMDCDTTGIEPDLALVKYKKLVGGGVIKIVNNTVPAALTKLGYNPDQVNAIVDHIDSSGTIEGAPYLKPEHLAVFDCSFRPQNGTRSIHFMGHVRMMAAAQPFISGAISKTINMPEESTPEDIMNAYTESWKLGLKAVAIYRDNSKRVQPLSSGTAKGAKAATASTSSAMTPPAEETKVVEKIVYRPIRRKLPEERRSITHKFSIGGHEGYLTVGLYEDGSPGELFITMAKEGSTISGLMDSFATAISYALQYGVPLKFFVDKFSHVRFEPSGWTGNEKVPYAKSIMDYIFRWLGAKFIGDEYAAGEAGESSKLAITEPEPQQKLPFSPAISDAPTCSECGGLMTRNGSCYKCENCGGTSGCS
ncbi:MAG TPA: vitamin B12-dependent ribonucleotide reductase [Bryobacteraceae bacterium]|nr:vitamin B12-dependent ribonucleotide reductase [Bryobacteraceae bacterium]